MCTGFVHVVETINIFLSIPYRRKLNFERYNESSCDFVQISSVVDPETFIPYPAPTFFKFFRFK
jgi:hypothetical protein